MKTKEVDTPEIGHRRPPRPVFDAAPVSVLTAPRLQRYVCVAFDPVRTGVLWDDRFEALTERHRLPLVLPAWNQASRLSEAIDNGESAGVILVLSRGLLGRKMIRLCRAVLNSGRRVYVYWPEEQTVECVDHERLDSFWRHWLALQLHTRWRRVQQKCAPLWRRLNSLRRLPVVRQVLPPPPAVSAPLPDRYHAIMTELERLIEHAQPVEMPWLPSMPARENPIEQPGLYLRTDFWAPIVSGGSYGHTCYVAKALSRVTHSVCCVMPHRYSMLDEFAPAVQHVVIDPPSATSSEHDIARATKHYYKSVKPLVELLKPAYIYERLCLGNYSGAKLSQKLGIPYIVEYNGSEIAMRRSFDGQGYELERLYLKAEMAAFQQATFISVISEPVKDDLVQRGIDPDKILVNPNAADPDDYRPPTWEERVQFRAELGWDDSHRVVGFTGTFGGWHGIDVLAEALPRICRGAPNVRFLLIGDGSYKSLVDEAIAAHRLQGQVHCTGRIPQAEGRRLLRACDIFVSPHNRHMVGSRFFGSPTKIFEYMAIGAGIVSSDLEQIGEVLSPGVRLSELQSERFAITDQRAVLCKPGDVEEFSLSVLALVNDPDTCAALGRNARQAVLTHHSWDRHIENLWRFQAARQQRRQTSNVAPEDASADERTRLETGDAYKDEVQNQWDSNPCGSHYVKNAPRHTLEWFLEAETYRYGSYAPWMPETMEFAHCAGKDVLEVGGGMGTDLAQFATHGARVTDVDLSAGHLALARENFQLRGLPGRFVHHDAETLPFPDDSFDLVYSNGVIHHTPNTTQVVQEIHRVLRPGGRAIVMVYAENSLHYWRNLFRDLGMEAGEVDYSSMGDIMSRHVEITENGAKPLVKVYTRPRLRQLFRDFADIQVVQRQITRPELPAWIRWMPLGLAGKLLGWNLVIKATKR